MPGRIERLRRAPARFVRNISLATRIALVIVLVALVSVVVTSIVGINRGSNLAGIEIDDQLGSVSAARAEQVERYVAGLGRALAGQALTPRAAQAIEEFSRLFEELDEEPASARDRTTVESYYRDVVAPELSTARDRPVGTESLMPVSDAATTLQARYVVPVPEDGIAPRELPEWAEIHDPLDDSLQEFALRVGFSDYYLIEPEAYVVVYSTAKDIDYATSLSAGPHSGSQLAALIDSLVDDPSPGDIGVRDIARYAPAGDSPNGFVAAPVFVDDELAGFVAGRFGPEAITAIMTNDQQWGSLGDRGETYLVGADTRMRSDARLFLEDQAAYFEQVEEAETATAEEIRSMRLFNTTVLFQEIDYRRVADVVDGATGVQNATNYLGREVLSEGRAVDIEGLDWVVFAEAETASLRAPIDDFTRDLLVAIAVFIVVVTFLAVRWADRLLEPLRTVSDRLRAIRDAGQTSRRTELPEDSSIEFVELSDDIDTMLATLRQRTATARRRSDERRRLLRRLLPAPIVERVEAGDRNVVDQVATATVAVVVVGGLGGLVNAGSSDRARELLDQFVDEADDLAAERGLDRINLSGDSYVAACGVSRPHLDHAARTMAFVIDLKDALPQLDPDGDLHVQVGLDVGPITVGITGGSRLIHETWGATVQHATDLARSARPGQVVVSDRCRPLLPSSYRFEAAEYDEAQVLSALAVESETST